MASFRLAAWFAWVMAAGTAMRQDVDIAQHAFADVFESLLARGSPLSPMAEGEIYTADKYMYDPRPGRDFESKTIIEMLETAAASNPKELAFRTPHMDELGNLVKKSWGTTSHKYEKYTWQQFRDRVMDAAASFVAMGLKPMDAVNIRGINSPEWLISFYGCIAAGGLPVGLYPTDSPEALEFKAKDSGAVFVVVAKASDLAIYSKFVDKVPSVKAVVLWNGRFVPEALPPQVVEAINTTERPLLSWAAFLEQGQCPSGACAREEIAERVKERVGGIKPGQAATVVYTSGTTGNPKGVMLSHDAVTWAVKQTSTILENPPKGGQHRILSYLPLNHVAGQMLDIIYPTFFTQSKKQYVTTMFPAMCYIKKVCNKEQLVDAKPTIFLGVPEVWDGLRLKIELATGSGLKKWLKNNLPSVVLGSIGLQKVQYALTGAGPITKDTLWFFNAMGINILNIYAQSESTALGTAWTPTFFSAYNLTEKFGSIGKALGNELKLDEETGEILLRGRNVMMGYMNRMDKTASAITEDGWLRTGDKGRVDEDGFVFLVGRIKEIMKSFGGEMIAPVAVEEGIKKACNADGLIVKQAIVQGDGYYYLSVFLTVVERAEEGVPTGDLTGAAKTVDPNATTVAEAQKSTAWAERLKACIGDYNKVAAKSPEKVLRFGILPEDITAEHSPDLMTPTFKIKREGVTARYQDILKACGGAPEDGPPGSLGGVKPCGA